MFSAQISQLKANIRKEIEINNNICLTSLTRAKLKEKMEFPA